MVIIAHNHPQGCPEPSYDDFNTTSKIMEVLAILNIPLIDHIIVVKNSCYSFAKEGTHATIHNEIDKIKRSELASRIMGLIKK